MAEVNIVWSDYMQYRASLRGFDLAAIERVLRNSTERYFDTSTGRQVVVGRHKQILIVVLYEIEPGTMTPVRYTRPLDSRLIPE